MLLDTETRTLPFLQPETIRDAKGRRPDELDYDPTTLYIPHSWFDDCKISAGQRQWWTFKATHFDSLLLFKVGKFYEVRGYSCGQMGSGYVCAVV